MSFDRLPQEMRQYNSWIVWRLEFDPERHAKPTKVPYNPSGYKANVVDPKTWGSYDVAITAPMTCLEPVHPDTPISDTGFSGLGFVFSTNDPYCGIDCDDTSGDAERLAFQQEIYLECNSYTELSPSGKGVHIIVKAKLAAAGKRRHAIELYAEGRFFTMTGNVYNNEPIKDCQPIVDRLYTALKGDVRQIVSVQPDAEQSDDDEVILNRANNAANAGKFAELWAGDWQKYYTSQSEGDFALIDILAFYTKYPPQIKRLFRQSMLGQRDKALRDDYVDAMIERAFDRQLPPIDIEGFRDKLNEYLAAGADVSATEPGRSSEDSPTTTAAKALASDMVLPQQTGTVNPFPQGLLGEIAQFFYDAAPRQTHDVAIAGAIGFLAGMTGRAYNTYTHAGLNQYILMLAGTGIGKDAVSSGRDKLLHAIAAQNPAILEFKGPGELVSAPGIIKWLANKPCVFSIVGEFGLKLKEMSAPNANAHLVGLRRTLMQMYSKSGHGQFFDPMAYSDKEKNTISIPAPSLTIFGESVPESFYEALDETMVMDGLMPRFMVFEYKGKRNYYNENSNKVVPSFELIQKVHDLGAYCHTIMQKGAVFPVPITPEAEDKFREYDRWTTDMINSANGGEVIKELWNRSHLKSIKLASLQAVGENYLNPLVTVDHVMWATTMMVEQTQRMIAKFETGMVGSASTTGESRQLKELMRAMLFMTTNREKYIATYGGKEEMFRDGIIIHSALAKKLAAQAAFRNDRMGPGFALKRALAHMEQADWIAEIGPKQMLEKYGTKAKAYVIKDALAFNQVHEK